MLNERQTSLSAPFALFISATAEVSVLKTVFIDNRELKCACVGGNGGVPLASFI